MDIRFVFEHPRFRPTVYGIINDTVRDKVDTAVRREVDDAFQYKLPVRLEALLDQKMPLHVEKYFLNHQRTQQILDRTTQQVEAQSRRVLERVTNEDPYQNAVFGPFMHNQQQRVDKTLQEVKTQSLEEMRGVQRTQTWQNVGIIGAIGLGVYAAFFNPPQS